MSQKTGLALSLAIAPAVAKKVKGVVMTASPSPTSRAIRETISASDPEETPVANFVSLKAAISFSRLSTSEPKMNFWDEATSKIF